MALDFHDILPGSSIHEVYEDVAAIYKKAFAEAEALASKGSLARALDLLDEAMATAPDMETRYALRIAQDLGMDLEVVKTDWAGLIPSLLSGNIDLIIAGMSPTAERKMTIDFTDNYYQTELVVVVRADGAYANATSLNDLSGAVICAQLNTFHDTVIDQIEGVVHDTPRETFPAMIVALNAGAIDGYVAERPGAEADVMANPGLTYIQFAEGQGFEASADDTAIAIGLVYGSPYKDAINQTLAAISEDERVQIMVDATSRQPLVAE